MDKLGDIYRFRSLEVTKDLNKAREWYTKAAAQGNVDAQVSLDALDNPDDNDDIQSSSPPRIMEV